MGYCNFNWNNYLKKSLSIDQILLINYGIVNEARELHIDCKNE
jgi:hypothetical protein